MSVETVTHCGEVYALILRTSYKHDGIEFFTPPNFSQQLGYMHRKKGYKIQPHIHKKIDRKVQLTNEVLFIKSGIVAVNFFDLEKNLIQTEVLYKGDVILLANGGHGFDILEDAEIIEVKQGPYAGDLDKEKF